MRDQFESRETWPFECLRCWHVWEEVYTVRRLTDNYGNEMVVWLRGTVTVQPPWSGASCPGCGAYHVTMFPHGYLRRHPELVPVPVPEPATVTEPPAVPVVARQMPARAPLPGRLLAAIGVPVALFVAYELYENLVAVTHPHTHS
ncbi:hypothetical protein ACIBHX_04470 [Nonomuraea sp. NPDC050536]|uniref:hypothetical protein n=1 Tax=Nonomuraea sp. NPDC050536 TaxID=3364366 RepID=UPI0037C998DE